MLVERRNVLGAIASLPAVPVLGFALPAEARRIRVFSLFVEAIIAGAVSGYVAGRIAEQGKMSFEIDANWNAGTHINAQRRFEAMDYPTERTVSIPAGRFEVAHVEVYRVQLPDAGARDLTCLVAKNHNTKRLFGVVTT